MQEPARFTGIRRWDEPPPGGAGQPAGLKTATFPNPNMFITAMLCLAFATVPAPAQANRTPAPGIRRVSRPRRSRPPAPTPGSRQPGRRRVSTSMGDITLELFKDSAPVSVENFLQYVS